MGWLILDPFTALVVVIVMFVVFITVFYAYLAERWVSLSPPPVQRVILDWPKSEIIENHENRRGYLMTHTIPYIDPTGTPLFKERRRGGTALYRNGIMAYFAKVAVEDVSEWSAFLYGYRAIAMLTYEFVPWSHVSGIFPIDVRDHGRSQEGRVLLTVMGFPVDLTRPSGTFQVFKGLQVETVDHRTALLIAREGDLRMFENLRDVLEPVWVALYHPEDRLLGYLWDKEFRKRDPVSRELEYHYEEYAKGDVFKHKAVRESASGEVVWF